jgi:soluble lytic murein transglycosylase-like protein
VGQLLRIPGNAAPAAAGASARTVDRVYVVRSGDNLTHVAARLHHSLPWLKAKNHLRGSTIYIGQRLSYTVPVGAGRSAAGPRTSTTVSRSVAHHRAVLARRALPGKAAVRTMVASAARRHGVPASLALALAYQESGFQQRVVSPVDAIGVMQVLPSTGRSLGRAYGRSFDLLKTSDNIEAGVLLLHDLLRATGSTPGALAGYYQGLGSVHQFGLLPQTRHYITNVTLLTRRFA